MQKNVVGLSYYQVMAFLFSIDEMREKNPYFHDNIVSTFESYVVLRASELSEYPAFMTKWVKSTRQFTISTSLLDYLGRLTSIDVFDGHFMKNFTRECIEKEKNISTAFINGSYKYKIK